jgi:prepilin-type N-terminal cleavage/methylation domain-containing protein
MQMSRRRGFSMIELLVTLTMMGILAGVAIPRMDLSRARSDAALRQLTMLCIQAQRTALSKQYNVILSVDQTTSRVRMVEDRNNSGVFDSGDRMTWMALEPGVTFVTAPAPLEGMTGTVNFLHPKVMDSFQSVIFRRNGAASSDGIVVFSAKPSDPGAARAVMITQGTGRADGYKWSGVQWVRAGI